MTDLWNTFVDVAVTYPAAVGTVTAMLVALMAALPWEAPRD